MGTGSSHLDDLLLSEIFRTPRQPAPEAEPQYRKPSKLAPTMQPPARAAVKKGYKNEWEEDDDDDEDWKISYYQFGRKEAKDAKDDDEEEEEEEEEEDEEEEDGWLVEYEHFNDH